jgi:hypothetical protein
MRITLILLACALPWPLTLAAPWIQDEDYLYFRGSYAIEQVEGLNAWRGDLFLDYGINDRWDVTFKFERVEYDNAQDFNSSGWQATIRRKLFARDGFVSALALGANEGRAVGGQGGCDAFGVEVRGSLGWSGIWRKRNQFMTAEVAGRFHEACERQRLELGVGRQISENFWTINQVWAERGNAGAESVKYQSELLWCRGAFDFSAGYRQEQGGVFDENSLFLALAHRY